MGAGWTAAQDTSADFYIEASVDNPTPFVGQQIIYTIRVYAADDQSDESPLYEPPDFEGFWRVDIEPFPFTQSPQQVNGRAYIVSEIRTALYPTLSGDLTITPANVILPETVFRPEQRIGSNTVTVKAQPLPEGAPAVATGIAAEPCDGWWSGSPANVAFSGRMPTVPGAVYVNVAAPTSFVVTVRLPPFTK
jgi:hypothetical protein